MKHLFARFLAPLLVCLFLSGCLTTTKLGGVVITITEVAPLSAGEISLTLTFSNENVVPIGVTSATYKLQLNKKLVARTRSEEAIGLPQLSKVAQKVVFKVEDAAFLKSLVSEAGAQNASYKLEGSLRVYSGDERLEIVSIDTGTLDLRPLVGKL